MRPKLRARKRRAESMPASDSDSSSDGPSTSGRGEGSSRRRSDHNQVDTVLEVLYSALAAGLRPDELELNQSMKDHLAGRSSLGSELRLIDEPTPPISPLRTSAGRRDADKGKGPLHGEESESSYFDGYSDLFEDDDEQINQSEASSAAQEIPAFTEGDNTTALRRAKLQKYFDSLKGSEVSDHVITECLLMARNPQMGASVGVTDFTNEVLPDFITSDPRFWTLLVKAEVENTPVDLAELNEDLHLEKKARKGPALTEVSYRYMAKYQPEYPEVDITDDLRAEARKAFPAFRWRFRIGADPLELYDNAAFDKVPKADRHIRVCTVFLDYGLRLPLSKFSCDVLNFYGRAPSQYTPHFFLLLSILEDINNSVYGPVTIDDIRSWFYVKLVGPRYMMFKRLHRKHICLFPNKTKYEDSACYEVGGSYTQPSSELFYFRPNFDSMLASLIPLISFACYILGYSTNVDPCSFAGCDRANAPLKKHYARSLESFCDLPAKARRQLCYVPPSLVCDVFPTGIELLGAQPSKDILDNLVGTTRDALTNIRAEQAKRRIARGKMTTEELLLLSDPSEDSVPGADEFAEGTHDKGMKKGALPDNLEEDVNSGYQPSSDGLMVKETAKRSGSQTSAQGQGRPGEKRRSSSKKGKRKASAEQGEQADDQAAAAAGDVAQPSKKKKKKHSKTRAAEGRAEEKDQEAQEAQDEGAAVKDTADQVQSTHSDKQTGGDDHIDLSTAADEPPPKQILPFVPIPRVAGSPVSVKENDRGIGHPQIATALMNSVILPADVEDYTKHSDRALMNRLSELTYEANVVRAAAARRQNFVDNRILVRDQRIKTLEEAGRKASEMMTIQIKRIASLEAANLNLRDNSANIEKMAALTEDAKLKLSQENAILEAEKATLEATLTELKRQLDLERESLSKSKAEVEAELEACKANQAKAEEVSKKNYTKGAEWQEHANRRGDFIADMLTKLGDTLSPEQHIQLEAFARDHRLNLKSIKEKSMRRRSSSLAKKVSTAEVSGSGSGSEQALSDVSAMERP